MTQHIRSRIAALALACAAAQLAAAGPPAGRTTPAESAVDGVFKRYDSRDTPGCSVAVIDAGKVVLKKSYGMADPALGVPMTSSTSSWIPYSEARIFVALAVAMLARDGKVSLDDPIRRHVPQVPAYASAVTLRQLLHHTSGLADYGVLTGPGFQLHDRLSEDEMFRILARWNKLGFAPGTERMYSNTDYALLKLLVERITGDSLHAFLDATLLQRLGMTATQIGSDQTDVRAGHALFHEAQGSGFHRLLRYRVSPIGGIAVTTSLDDLIRWDGALRDPALGLGALLKSLEQGAPARESAGADEGFAFGVFRRTQAGLPLVEYHGVGEFTYLVQVPSANLSVATLCNAYEGTSTFALEVAALYAGVSPASNASAEKPDPDTMPRKPAVPVNVTPAELRRYVGEYRDAEGRPQVDVGIVDGALVITPRGRPAIPGLIAIGNGQFASATPYLFAFTPSGGGNLKLTSWEAASGEPGGPDLHRWQPVPLTAEALGSYPGTYIGDDVEVVLHVRVDGGRIVLATRGMVEAELSPQGKPDAFRLPELYTARFERDAAGRVTALVLDASRVKGMRFARAP